MEPLKNVYSPDYIARLASALKDQEPSFRTGFFQQLVMDDTWADLELKQRMRRITSCLHQTLPDDYEQALDILKRAAPQFGGYAALFFPDYVELYGQDHWDLSLPALAWLTRFSSSELAVRPFIKKDPQRMMEQLNQWATDENYHVRRLASEGCRPRLPWAMALPEFKKDPAPILPVLEKLKGDSEDYVRRSVANNLNDISKDHPDITLDVARNWLGRHRHTDWIVKHACRTLLKAGRPDALILFGYGAPDRVRVKNLTLKSPTILIGESLHFGFDLITEEPARLRLEYGIHYMKKGGKTSRKVFKITENQYPQGETGFSRRQGFADLTTRKHYPGRHELEVIVNGVVKATVDFQLGA